MTQIPRQPAAVPPPAEATRPSAIREIEERAAAGDVDGVLQLLHNVMPGLYSAGHLDHLLWIAIDAASRKSPEDYAAASYRQMAKYLHYVLSRLHVVMLREMRTGDSGDCARRLQNADDPLGQLLPAIQRVSRSLGDLHVAQAKTSRQLQLARRGEDDPRRGHKRRRPPNDFQDGDLDDDPNW